MKSGVKWPLSKTPHPDCSRRAVCCHPAWLTPSSLGELVIELVVSRFGITHQQNPLKCKVMISMRLMPCIIPSPVFVLYLGSGGEISSTHLELCEWPCSPFSVGALERIVNIHMYNVYYVRRQASLCVCASLSACVFVFAVCVRTITLGAVFILNICYIN